MSLGGNLRYLCSFQPSIASVCRDLAINRQQFNRYLREENYPRGYNLKRICDYFNTTEAQLNLSQKAFQTSYKSADKTADKNFQLVGSALKILNEKSAGNLDKYLGYYYEYYYSMSCPTRILRGLVSLKKIEDAVYYERFERLAEQDDGGPISYCHYKGLALFLNERIFMVDYESITSNEVAEIILYPSFKQKISILEGSLIGVSASATRQPLTRHIILEYIGSAISLKNRLKECYLYPPGSELIPESIHSRLVSATD